MAEKTHEVSHLDTRLESVTLPLVLRTIMPSDNERHAQLITDMVRADDPSAEGITPARSSELIEGQRKSAAEPTVFDAASGTVRSGPSRVNMILELASGEIVGLGGYGAIKDWERDGKKIRAGDCGVVVDDEHRKKGYGVEAMRLAIDWAFTPVDKGGPQLDLVTVTTLADNKPMIALTEGKLGLKGLGVKRPSEFGQPQGEMYYELTPEMWAKTKPQTQTQA